MNPEIEGKYTPRKGAIIQQEQDRIEKEIEAGERRYFDSVMADELSNDPESFEEEFNG